MTATIQSNLPSRLHRPRPQLLSNPRPNLSRRNLAYPSGLGVVKYIFTNGFSTLSTTYKKVPLKTLDTPLHSNRRLAQCPRTTKPRSQNPRIGWRRLRFRAPPAASSDVQPNDNKPLTPVSGKQSNFGPRAPPGSGIYRFGPWQGIMPSKAFPTTYNLPASEASVLQPRHSTSAKCHDALPF
jgi:hypothetical protein